MMWTGFIWLSTKKSGGSCQHDNEPSVDKNTENIVSRWKTISVPQDTAPSGWLVNYWVSYFWVFQLVAKFRMCKCNSRAETEKFLCRCTKPNNWPRLQIRQVQAHSHVGCTVIDSFLVLTWLFVKIPGIKLFHLVSRLGMDAATATFSQDFMVCKRQPASPSSSPSPFTVSTEHNFKFTAASNLSPAT